MEFKLAQLDGKNILNDGVSGIFYSRQERKRLVVSEESVNNDGTHGRIVSGTYARKRVITLEGYIDRGSNEESSILYLERLFALSEGEDGARELYIQDNFDNERTITAKVSEPFSYDYADNSMPEAYRKWRVTLESTESPIYKSYSEIVESGLEGQYGGVKLGCKLGTKLNNYYNLIECETLGNQPAPVKFVITVVGNINKPLTIKNLTNGTQFSLNIDALAGDVIVIDSNTSTATLNGVNVLADRIEGSIFPYVKDTTVFTIFDLDGDLYEKDLSVDIYFRNNLL